MLESGADRDDGRLPGAAGRRGRDEHYDRTDMTLTRVESKLDGFIQAQQIRDESMRNDLKYIRETHVATSTDHEARIRALESKIVEPGRILALEQKRYVEPRTMITTITILIALGTLIIAIVNSVQ